MKNSILLAVMLTSASVGLSQTLSDGTKLYQSKRHMQAKEIFSAFGEAHKDYNQGQFYLGRIAYDEGHYEQSITYLQGLVDRGNASSEVYYWLATAMGAIAEDANVFKQAVMGPKIREALEKAVATDSSNFEACVRLVEFYAFAPGIVGGSWEKAEALASELEHLDTPCWHVAKGKILEAKKHYDQAEREYLQAVKLDGIHGIDLGFLYQEQAQYDEAFDAFEKACKKDSNNEVALYQIGKTSALTGDRAARGIACLNRYLEIKPKANKEWRSAAMMRLAMIHEKTGNTGEARALYEQSLRQDPDNDESKKGLRRLD